MRSRKIITTLLAAIITSCTALDGDDRDDLESAVNRVNEKDRIAMAGMVMRSKTRNWLDGLPRNTRVFQIKCTHKLHPDDIEWTEWRQEIDIFATVADVISCMDGEFLTYSTCLDKLTEEMTQRAEKRWQDRKDASSSILDKQIETECQEEIDHGFNTMQAPGADDELNRVSAGDIVDWILRTPAPPFGLSPSLIGALAPFVCALSQADGWCDAAPRGPDVVIVPAPSGGSGDYP